MYDKSRVADPTAHQAISVARMVIFADLTPEEQAGLKNSVKGNTDGPSLSVDLCEKYRKIGPPSYFPKYMIQHGMGAFLGRSGNGLVDSFEAQAEWKKAFDSYTHCPSAL